MNNWDVELTPIESLANKVSILEDRIKYLEDYIISKEEEELEND